MDKQKLLDALNALQDGEEAGALHDELVTLVELTSNAKDQDIQTAWERISNVD